MAIATFILLCSVASLILMGAGLCVQISCSNEQSRLLGNLLHRRHEVLYDSDEDFIIPQIEGH